jgi:hypothetical protein
MMTVFSQPRDYLSQTHSETIPYATRKYCGLSRRSIGNQAAEILIEDFDKHSRSEPWLVCSIDYLEPKFVVTEVGR